MVHAFAYSLYFTLYKTDISKTDTKGPAPKVSVLERVDCNSLKIRRVGSSGKADKQGGEEKGSES